VRHRVPTPPPSRRPSARPFSPDMKSSSGRPTPSASRCPWIWSRSTIWYVSLKMLLKFCSVLFCCVLFCSVLFCSVPFRSVLFLSVLFRSVPFLFFSVLFCSVLFCYALFCSVLFLMAHVYITRCWNNVLSLITFNFLNYVCWFDIMLFFNIG